MVIVIKLDKVTLNFIVQLLELGSYFENLEGHICMNDEKVSLMSNKFVVGFKNWRKMVIHHVDAIIHLL